MVQTHAAPISAALGLGDQALEGLQRLRDNLHPNGLWSCGGNPCLEAALAPLNIIQNMLLQSWSDPAAAEPGPIRIFPAVPATWRDVEFHNLRAEGAFLVSARRHAGETEWVRIESLAGEPCRVRPGISGAVTGSGRRTHRLTAVSSGVYELDLRRGETITLSGIRSGVEVE
jgi:hypothetical protein